MFWLEGMRACPPGRRRRSRHQLRAQRRVQPGLQQTRALGFVSQLAQNATGSAPTAWLSFRRGCRAAGQHHPAGAWRWTTRALGKTADAQQPLRYEQMVARRSLVPVAAGAAPPPLRDRVTLDLGSIGSATYLRDLAGAQPQVLRGSMGVGLSAR